MHAFLYSSNAERAGVRAFGACQARRMKSPSLPGMRATGATYVAITLLGPVVLMGVPARFLVVGDARATAAAIQLEPRLFGLGMLGHLLLCVLELVLSWQLASMLRVATLRTAQRGQTSLRSLVHLLALLRVAMALLQAANLLPLGLARAWAGPGLPYRPDAVLVAWECHFGFAWVWQAVFAGHLAVLGYVVTSARELPRSLGVLLAIASACYLMDACVGLVMPALRVITEPIVVVGALLGELPFVLYLLIAGPSPRAGDAREPNHAVADRSRLG
jgi:hypothetical protein